MSGVNLVASALPKPKDRVKVIYLTMLLSLGTENFGWFPVPIMSA